MEPKIKIETYFGTKEFTKAEFAQRWRDVVAECIWLADTPEDADIVRKMKADVTAMAERQFDRNLAASKK